MPKYQQEIVLPGADKENSLAIAYETFKSLGWPVTYAGDDRLIGNTPGTRTKRQQQFITSFDNGSLVLQSIMINNESFDLSGVNKKNTAVFKSAFENTKPKISTENIESNKSVINSLRQQTAVAAAQQQKEAEEITAAMKPAGSNLFMTYALIAINVIVFILMIIDGAGFFAENPFVHIKWGSNFAALTLSGDYWRLVTNTFIHFGIIHLVMNMYCLYIIGAYLEPMLGKVKFTSAYFCTGVLASIASLWWHRTDPVNSAGASGAIFGMYGLFLALLTTNLIPQSVRQTLLKSIGIFIFYNLVYGMKSGVDNSAHVGGLISGFIVGYLYVLNLRAQKKGLSANWVLPVVLILTAAVTVTYLQQHEAPASERQAITGEIRDGMHKDLAAFNDKYNDFVRLQDTAIAPLNKPGAVYDEALKQKLTDISAPAWKSAEIIAREMQQMDVGESAHRRADLVLKYVSLRQEELNSVFDIINKLPGSEEKLDSIEMKINAAVTELGK